MQYCIVFAYVFVVICLVKGNPLDETTIGFEFLKELSELRQYQRESDARFRVIEAKLTKFNKEHSTLKAKSSDADTELKHIQQALSEKDTAIKELKQKYELAESEISSLKLRLSDTEFEQEGNNDMKTKTSMNEMQEVDTNGAMATAVFSAFHPKRHVSGTVAFSATATPQTLTNLGLHHTIIYDKAITNIGSAYRTTSGIFTAPIHGFYVFYEAAIQHPGSHMHMEIVKDGQIISRSYMGSQGSVDLNMSGNFVIVELAKSNQVWVRTGDVGQINGEGITSFSGFLLF